MQMKIATILALLPFFVAAAPAAPDARNGLKIPLTKRATFIKENGVVDLEALRSRHARIQGKILRGFENYHKNTGSVHPNYVHGAIQKRDGGSGTVALKDDNSQLWEGEITVGTPPVTFKVDFDTGSSDLFLPGKDCGDTCSGHTAYDTSKSSTAKDLGQQFSLKYGDGSTVDGEVFSDTVTIGGLTASNQSVGAAKQYSDGFGSQHFPPDGLMGMAFEQISEYKAPPVFQSLVKEKQVGSAEFGFTLLESGSELYLGGVDKSKVSGDLTYTAVTTPGYWQIKFDGVKMSGGGSNGTGSGSGSGSNDTRIINKRDATDAIVDTGTTLVYGDSATVKGVYDKIPGAKDASSTAGQGLYTIPCDGVPDGITVSIEGKDFPISKESFNLGPVSDGSKDCVGGFVADDSMGFWILGDVFLRNVYTSFDLGGSRVGFATLSE